MPWRQCKRCGWWQKHAGPCAGCLQSKQSLATPLPTPPPAPPVLHERWQLAKKGAQDPKHTKVERMCPACFLRTVGKSPTCRGCHRSLDHCLQIFPCQWPPIGASAALLSTYDGKAPTTAHQTTASGDQKDEPMPESPAPDKPGAQDTPSDETKQTINKTSREERKKTRERERERQRKREWKREKEAKS